MITTAKQSSILQGFPKYRSMLAGYVLNSYESIATSTTSGVSTITFSGIPADYQHLQLRISMLFATGGSGIYLQFNGDTATNYSRHSMWGTSTTTDKTGTASINKIYLFGAGPGAANGSYATSIMADIFDYKSSTYKKAVKSFAGTTNASSQSATEYATGFWNSTSTITSLTITTDNNWSAGTSIALYGIKSA